MTLLEAMAAGKPCVVSDVGDNTMLIRDGETGFVVPPGDVFLLTDRLGTLVADPQLRSRMGRKARQESTKYTEKDMVRSVVKVYDDLEVTW
jgi:glycosyltransferase involved in cell wall biosynthesis